jgi:hypothetical protein
MSDNPLNRIHAFDRISGLRYDDILRRRSVGGVRDGRHHRSIAIRVVLSEDPHVFSGMLGDDAALYPALCLRWGGWFAEKRRSLLRRQQGAGIERCMLSRPDSRLHECEGDAEKAYADAEMRRCHTATSFVLGAIRLADPGIYRRGLFRPSSLCARCCHRQATSSNGDWAL